jgi:glyoxylase-like metal-dependent hydrolase (beta-lactamase superfamily II)
MVGERPKPFGEAFGFDPITSTLIFGEHDAVLVDAMTTVAEAEALAHWVALHNRNLETIYITHAHFDHFYGLSILLDRFPGARAIAAQDGEGHQADLSLSRGEAASQPVVSWASAHQVGST